MTAARDLSQAVGAVVAAVRATAPDPADQIRALLAMAAVPGSTPVAVRCRRAAVIGLARAARSYWPSSADDAQAVLDQVTDAIDIEVTAAGDAGDDASFNALRRLRAAVAVDLRNRGAGLASLITVTNPVTLPALVMTTMLYNDATRTDEVVRRVDPIHPAFMPTSVTVLAS